MSWTADERKAVGNAMLGSWPGTITGWGREAFALYVGELEARGLTAESVVLAIRTWDGGSDFPPSAPNLAAAARRDPQLPTFEECLAQLYEPGGLFGFKRSGVTVSPWVEAFADSFGRERLRLLEVDDPDEGKWRRRDLREAWQRFVEASAGREAVALASGRHGGLRAFDPLAGLAGPPVELESGGARRVGVLHDSRDVREEQ